MLLERLRLLSIICIVIVNTCQILKQLTLWLYSSWKPPFAQTLCLILEIGFFFVVSVTPCIVVLFHVRIRADLLLQNDAFLNNKST